MKYFLLIFLVVLLVGCVQNSGTATDKNQGNLNQLPAGQNTATAGTVNYDPASALGSKIAESANPNPLRNISLNPFSDKT